MPTWLKILLAIFVLFIALIAAAIFFGYRWMRDHRGEIREGAQKSIAQAREFGRDKDANACVAEALNRGDKCGAFGMMCEVRTGLFMKNCIDVAAGPPDFCKNVPKMTNILATVGWAKNECARRGHPNEQRCARLLQTVQRVCQEQP